jgi:hypothetical protein
MWVGTSGASSKVANVDEVAIREAEIWTHRDCVWVRPRVLALETAQSCVMRWEAACMVEYSGRALNDCLQEGGARGMDLSGDSVCRHGDESEVRGGGVLRLFVSLPCIMHEFHDSCTCMLCMHDGAEKWFYFATARAWIG